jgi:hypothetical protein
MNGKNFAWIEFVKTADAIAFKGQYSDSSPLIIRDRGVRIEFAVPRPTVGGPEETSELVLRYNVSGISSEEAMRLAKERFPDAELTTSELNGCGGCTCSTFFVVLI